MKKSCPGFTLIELLITISITAILFSIGVAQYMRFNRQQILDQAALELRTNLTQARNMALAGKKTCTGVFDGVLVEAIGDEGYQISSRCGNGADKVLIEKHQFGQGIIRTGVFAPNGVLFKPLTGGTNLNSDETITLFLAGVGQAEVQVARSGKIELVE